MLIANINDIRGENIDWVAFGKRFQQFRKAQNLSKLNAGNALGITEATISKLEAGFKSSNDTTRKSINIIWAVSLQWNLSINWLLNGLGKPHSSDPLPLTPDTLLIQRGAGIRRNQTRTQAEEGNFSDYVLEFVIAIDKFKSKNQVTFPSLTQIYEIIMALGYRKSVPARIAPLGHIVEHQQWAEKLKLINEIIEPDSDRLWDKKCFQTKPTKKPRTYKTTPKPKTIKKRKIKKSSSPPKHPKDAMIILAAPNGKQYMISNLTQFCEEHQLMSTRIRAVSLGKRKHHKGWTVVPKFTPQIETNPILDRIQLGLK